MRVGTSLLALLGAAAALAALAGCGSDSNDETSAPSPSPTEVSIPSPTSPIPTTTAATPTTTGGGKTKPAQTPQTTTSPPATSGPCSVPDAYQDFRYTGIDCTAAVGIAKAWDRNGKVCNTIDNPNSPQGYNRTCSVEGFTCAAKRDVKSDARFVNCTQGGQSIRFTWLPA